MVIQIQLIGENILFIYGKERPLIIIVQKLAKQLRTFIVCDEINSINGHADEFVDLLGWTQEYLEGTAHKCHGSGQQASLLAQQPLQPKALELQFLITTE